VISVLIVNHNGERYIARCLRSLGDIRLDELEVVVVDNASTDGSLDVLLRDFGHLTILPQELNLGFGAATNLAARRARGEQLLLLNPDAWMVGDGLQRMQSRLESDPRLALVAPRLSYGDGRPQFVWAPDRSVVGEIVQKARNPLESWSWNHRQLVWLLRRLLGPGWYTAACLLVRREAFDEVGGFDPKFFMYFEDADLCVRLRQHGWKTAYLKSAEVRHERSTSPPSGESDLIYRRSQLYYYRKHRPAWEVAVLTRYLSWKYRHGAVADWLREDLPRTPDAAGETGPRER
jgi:GT2 family glycosyltransferase